MRRGILETREKIAVSVLNGLCQQIPSELVKEISEGQRGGKDYIQAANVLASGMLASFGVYDERVAHAEERAMRAETALSVLQSIHSAAQGNFCGLALAEIWELLGVNNQTAAITMLRNMVEVMKFLDEPDHAKLMERMRLARQEHSL